MSEKSSISAGVVIVNYNSSEYTCHCIESITAAAKTAPIALSFFVIDNNSTDKVDQIAKLFPHVNLTINPTNRGFAKAVNQGIAKIETPYILLVNPDSVINPGFFEPLLHFMDENQDVGILGPKILDYDGTIQGSARSFPSALTSIFGRDTYLSKRFPNNPFTRKNILTDRVNGNKPIEVDWVSGACMLVRKKAISQTGLLDERFFMYWEDADWCRRMSQHGWSVVYHPGATMFHKAGASSEKRAIRSILEFHKSTFRYFSKHKHPLFFPATPFVAAALFARLSFVLVARSLEGRFNSPSETSMDLPNDSS